MRNVTVGLYVLVFLLVSVNCVICQSATNNDYGIVINKRYVEPAEWTFMVFVNGDNDLEQAAIEDLNEMEQVGSSAGVNIIVQIDRSSGFSWDGYFDDDTSNGNWQGAKRYYVTRDSNTAIINSPEIQDLGEIDMGDPDVLVDFATWTISNYPAQRYALVLWNHGSGLGVEYDRSKRLSPRAISYDDDSGNNISINELGTALSGITANTGVRLDLLGFDACLMAMIEIDYQVMSYADTAVSSEELEPGDGWDYQGLLAALTGNPEMTSLQFGAEIVRTFAADYGPFGDTTLSTINLKHINSAAQALDALARLLATNCSKYRDQIELSRRQTQQYQVATYIDLYDFVDKIKAHVSDSTIRTAAATLLAALSECTISESHGSRSPGSHGISIYFPSSESAYVNQYTTDVQLSTDNHWNNFLSTYFNKQTNEFPVADAGSDVSVEYNTQVVLDGSNSVDPDNSPGSLSYTWSQTSGTTVTLSNSTVVQPSFIAPESTDILVFQLVVYDGSNFSGPDDVTVTVGSAGVDEQVTGIRELPLSYLSNSNLKVVLNLEVDETNTPNGVIVKEFLPPGWTVKLSTPNYNDFNSETGELKWLFYGSTVNDSDMDIVYEIQIPVNETGEKSFRGEILYSDNQGNPINQAVSGNTKISDAVLHPADNSHDWIIDDFELLDYIDTWASGSVGDFELLDCVDLWAGGSYQWDSESGVWVSGQSVL